MEKATWGLHFLGIAPPAPHAPAAEQNEQPPSPLNNATFAARTAYSPGEEFRRAHALSDSKAARSVIPHRENYP